MLCNKPIFLILFLFLTCLGVVTFASHGYETAAVAGAGCAGSSTVVKKGERQVLVSTEFGQISAVNVTDGIGGHYHLQFITMEPNALFLPVVLHADMVFYVHTGNGSLSWLEVELDTTSNVDLLTGDVYRLPAGSIFYFQSSLEAQRSKLRIYAMFVNSNSNGAPYQEPALPIGAYSSIRDLLLGFDRKVLQAAFQASDEALEELMAGERLPAIVHANLAKSEEKEKKKKKGGKNIESRFMDAIMGGCNGGRRSYRMMLNFNDEILKKKKKKKKTDHTFNFKSADHDFENCNGWSVTVTNKNMKSLREADIGLFMVNLIRGAMMGPHWNPLATEVGIVVQGPGMVMTVSNDGKSCRFKVEEGDVFVVPRFSMMAQLAYINESFVFMGFSSSSSMNHPQYTAGKASVLQALDRQVLSLSLNVTNTTMAQILNPGVESIILECGSCAEEEERIMYEEIRKEEEAARKRKEEEEEEEARKRKEEEEEAARKREEEEEEEAARKREEEEEEEAARKREEEEARKREEEEEEAARKREEEEARKREEEEEEAARKRKEEEEEEEARKRKEEEEAEARKREEEEAARKREEEEEMRRREEEEEEEAARREEEAARRQEQEQQEAARREEEEEEAARKREEEEEQKESPPEPKEEQQQK